MDTTNYVKSNIKMMWVLFVIYPLGALIIAAKNFKNKEFRIFILAFFVLFGYSFVIVDESDGSRYRDDFVVANEYTFNQYSDDIQQVFVGKAINPDFYSLTLKYVAKFFSNNYHFYFALAAFIYFFVYLKFLGEIWDKIYEISAKFYLNFFIGIVFLFTISAGINGIRFPLALWVFSYGAWNLILKDQFKYLIIASLSILIHFSLNFSFIFLIIFYASRYNSNRNLLLTLLALVFVSISAFPGIFEALMNFLGGSMGDKMAGYSDDDYIDSRKDIVVQWNWYVAFNLFGSYYFSIIAVLLSKFKTFKLKFDTTSNRLFGFVIIMLIHSLFSAAVVDPISNRYAILVNLFSLIYLMYLSANNSESKLLKVMNYIYLPILVISVLVKLRVDLDTFNSVLFFGNAIMVFIIDSSISIQELLIR
jgi:hypothetical protein